MTTIQLTQGVTELNGDPVMVGEKPYSVREVFAQALGQQAPNEELDGATKLKLYRLGTRLYEADEVKLNTEEAALIKERVGKFFGPIIYGQVCDLIDPPAEDD